MSKDHWNAASRAIAASATFALLAITGCDSGVQRAVVSGTVLIDGRPLELGEIMFVADDKRISPDFTHIVNGKYELSTLPGPRKVKIRATRPALHADPETGFFPSEPRLGPEYNENTAFTVDLKPGYNRGLDYQVKELPKKE